MQTTVWYISHAALSVPPHLFSWLKRSGGAWEQSHRLSHWVKWCVNLKLPGVPLWRRLCSSNLAVGTLGADPTWREHKDGGGALLILWVQWGDRLCHKSAVLLPNHPVKLQDIQLSIMVYVKDFDELSCLWPGHWGLSVCIQVYYSLHIHLYWWNQTAGAWLQLPHSLFVKLIMCGQASELLHR